MPLLEINQIRPISASVRLDESTAEQVDQCAASVHAHRRWSGQSARLCLLERPRLSGFSEDASGQTGSFDILVSVGSEPWCGG
jgi:hypothetical protein